MERRITHTYTWDGDGSKEEKNFRSQSEFQACQYHGENAMSEAKKYFLSHDEKT